MKNKAEIYCVGGAVRDALLNLPVCDRDWVVVGSTPESMLAEGYRPVGKDFPVFLHPTSHEEYALARTERKTAPGYQGFAVHAAPDVTLEQDLLRRDFTINAMAQAADGTLIDPYGGQTDLRAGVLRHVSEAFREDPVRILRGARFAARFNFQIAPETLALMRDMVDNGEVDALVPERVWQELSRGIMEAQPSRFFSVLRDCGALAKLLPEIDGLFGVPQPPKYHPEIDCGIHTLMVIDDAARHGYALPTRFAALMHDLGKATTPKDILPRHIGHEERGYHLVKKLSARLRVPTECRDLALLVARYHGNFHAAFNLRPDTIVKFFQLTDAWRKPERFVEVLNACASDARGRKDFEHTDYPQAAYLLKLLEIARQVDGGDIARQFEAGALRGCDSIPNCLARARIHAITPFLHPKKDAPT